MEDIPPMPHKYFVGDPVWSKMRGYCPWPSRIADPSESMLRKPTADKNQSPKPIYLVYFFGSNNFAWMPEDTVKPYEEFKDKFIKGSKNTQFKQGCTQIEEYLKDGGKAKLVEQLNSSSAINYNDDATSPSVAGDSLSNDPGNPDGDLPTIDDELAVIKKTPASSSVASRKFKNSNDSQNDSTSLTSPVSVQKDYSRTPFKNSRKTARSDDTTNDIASPTKRAKNTEDDSHGSSSHSASTTVPTSTISSSRSQIGKSAARTAILRTQVHDMPIIETPRINFSSISVKSKNIRPSNLNFGFIGLGFMGGRLLKCLLDSGHKVTIYNRSTTKMEGFIEAGAIKATTPVDVINDTDIVFLSLPDPKNSKEVVFGSFGLLSGNDIDKKGIIELSSIDPETSNDISEAITARGGRYLEAPAIMSGSHAAEEGDLIIVAAGSKELYTDASTCFQAMAKKSFFLSHDVGNASRMNIIVSMLYGAIIGAVCESTNLLRVNDNQGLSSSDFREILELSSMNCPLVLNTLDRILQEEKVKNKPTQVPLMHLQKDLKFGLALAETIHQSTPITGIVNEIFKAARKEGMNEMDATSIYRLGRF